VQDTTNGIAGARPPFSTPAASPHLPLPTVSSPRSTAATCNAASAASPWNNRDQSGS
jgi:hypothetical protein